MMNRSSSAYTMSSSYPPKFDGLVPQDKSFQNFTVNDIANARFLNAYRITAEDVASGVTLAELLRKVPVVTEGPDGFQVITLYVNPETGKVVQTAGTLPPGDLCALLETAATP